MIDTMRLAIVTDIHGNLPALEAVIADFSARGIDHVLQLGDSVSGPLWPRPTLERIAALGCVNIRGNHDRVVATGMDMNAGDQYARDALSAGQIAWLARWPSILQWHADVLLFHGRPHDDLNYLLEDPAKGYAWLRPVADIERDVEGFSSRLMLCGHSHVPRCVHLTDGRIIVNGGSVGLQAYRDSDGGDHVIENGSPHARYMLVTLTDSRIDVAQIAVQYDWSMASRQAADNGRPDWARWLATGRA
jgi:predicted phosphodiesterase